METKEVRIRCFGHWRDMLDFEYGAARKEERERTHRRFMDVLKETCRGLRHSSR